MMDKICFLLVLASLLVSNYAQANINNSYVLRDLERAEATVFGRNNVNQPLETRVALMEQNLFGTIQSGNLNDRINFVNKVLSNSNGYYNMNYPPKNKLRAALNNLFTGTMTGFTPTVYPNVYSNTYNKYPSRYLNNGYVRKNPRPYYNRGNGNFITQTRVIIDD